MKILKNISFYIVIALAINILSVCLKSEFLKNFLFENIVIVLITLMAINTATSSLIVSKLEEVAQERDIKFQKTYKEIRISLIEQMILIGLAILLSVLNDSKIIKDWIDYHQFVFNTLITTIFIYALDILRDTGMAIFKIIEAKQQLKEKNLNGKKQK